MKIIKPYIEILDNIDGIKILKNIEKYGRTCYKSEDKITEDSCKKFVKEKVDRGHGSVIEHEKITVRVVCDRGVTHEIVRHRIGSYSQESTRYCNYTKGKFGGELTFIEPCFWKENNKLKEQVDLDDYSRCIAETKEDLWMYALQICEFVYEELIDNGATPQEARSVLPNSLKTEIIITYNLREWRHFFKLRCAKDAHPQMREVALMILKEFKEKIPIIFDNIK